MEKVNHRYHRAIIEILIECLNYNSCIKTTHEYFNKAIGYCIMGSTNPIYLVCNHNNHIYNTICQNFRKPSSNFYNSIGNGTGFQV